MTPDEFVEAVEKVVYSGAVTGTVEALRAGPAGRGSGARARALHEWYGSLGTDDQDMVAEVVRDAAHAAVFGFLCVLDGVVAIDDPPHAEVRLMVVHPDGGEAVLNDESVEALHDRFNALVHPPTETWSKRGGD